MSKRKRNYSRFYALAKEKHIDLEQHKEVLVSQFTDGRTSSLREMTIAEYEDMCDCLQSGKQRGESSEAYQARLRKARSAVLNRMQRLGVDTSDKTFAAVNKFCMNPRISGKPFGLLTIDELEALIPKLEAILRKPKVRGPIPIFFNPNRHQLPS
ncbi:MAG: hypothetical protein J6Q29_02010 [Alistipes sp.]|nr:hypothetical protein [Alistipes sp.]